MAGFQADPFQPRAYYHAQFYNSGLLRVVQGHETANYRYSGSS